ncbi:unnamed protein product [Clavelina lepadiformis]|uniref:Uncharacterized protein n=1 Tax=Clavelina lepadiformis TaxID=159417 RepID=A0ABP0GMZ1_CLALP
MDLKRKWFLRYFCLSRQPENNTRENKRTNSRELALTRTILDLGASTNMMFEAEIIETVTARRWGVSTARKNRSVMSTTSNHFPWKVWAMLNAQNEFIYIFGLQDPSNAQEYLYVNVDQSKRKLKLTTGSDPFASHLPENDPRKFQHVRLLATGNEHFRHVATDLFVGKNPNARNGRLELVDERNAVAFNLERLT